MLYDPTTDVSFQYWKINVSLNQKQYVVWNVYCSCYTGRHLSSAEGFKISQWNLLTSPSGLFQLLLLFVFCDPCMYITQEHSFSDEYWAFSQKELTILVISFSMQIGCQTVSSHWNHSCICNTPEVVAAVFLLQLLGIRMGTYLIVCSIQELLHHCLSCCNVHLHGLLITITLHIMEARLSATAKASILYRICAVGIGHFHDQGYNSMQNKNIVGNCMKKIGCL